MHRMRSMRCFSSLAMRSRSVVHLRKMHGISSLRCLTRPGTSLRMEKVRLFSQSSYPAHEVMGMPALSPTMEVGTIVRWTKKEGEAFSAGQVVCEIETDKATVDYEAQDDGYLAKILCEEGKTDVPVGSPIFIMVEEQEDVEAFVSYTGEATEKASAPEVPAAVPVAPVSSPVPVMTMPDTAPIKATNGRVVASPLARKFARENGIALEGLKGTGPNGRIVFADVESGATSSVGSLVSAASSIVNRVSNGADSTYADGPVSDYSRAYADQMTVQKASVPHYHLTTVLNLDNLLNARDQLNMNALEGEEVAVNDFLLRAAALAMKQVPQVNAAWMDTFIRQFDNAHINVVMSSSGAVVAPVVAHAETLPVRAISAHVRHLQTKVDSNNISGQELQGGTFTVSNMGMYGISTLSAIVSPMQSCSLGLGTIENVLVPHAIHGYASSAQMKATLACDHRVVDGAIGAQWLAAFKGLAENPVQLLV